MNEESMQPVEDFTKVESIFVRHRNCLLVRGQFTPIYTGYYIHLLEHKLRYANEMDATLKDMLAVLTLHLTARPWAETIAWTANLRAPRVNYFVTGSSTFENITGRLFTKDVREPDRNLLYSQTSVSGQEPSVTTIDLASNDPIEWIEHYYQQSEQRPARCFRLDDENYALIAAQPDYDEEWFDSLDANMAAQITEDEQTKVLETRQYQFDCGCSKERILPALSSWQNKLDELFHGEDSIKVNCPRCGASYEVTPSDLG
ncbi:MAG: Hsp33 family molecular chaperone HslO [Verrucomicrobiae bacterium]|nr:Hsp33 family molecular chaperone HslO [Verrucomicrobiae bacterium]NNJ43468.1 disulfide bond chaperone [Akkermansiaceae bacterium]